MSIFTTIIAGCSFSQVLPIENQMKRPKEMLGFCGVLNTSMTIVAAMYVAMGFFGYLKYGESISACITLNLPINDILTQVVLCLFCFAIFISYALQFYVIIDIVQRNFLLPRLGEESRWLVPAEMLVRILINLVTCKEENFFLVRIGPTGLPLLFCSLLCCHGSVAGSGRFPPRRSENVDSGAHDAGNY